MKKSFTLIEVLVVVLLIGIVSSFVYLSTESFRQDSNQAKVLMFSEKIKSSLAQNIAGEWNLDEGTGSSVYDFSGNGNTGTITGATWETNRANCVLGKCLSFSGSNQYIEKTSPSDLPSGQSARTISVWIYPNNVNPGGVLVALNNSAGSSQSFIINTAYISSNTYLFTDGINSNNNITISGTEIAQTGKWNHVAFVFDGSTGWKYYLNGENKKSGSFSTTINTVVTSFSIGRRGDGANTGYYWPGKIDEVVVFDGATTSIFIKNYYVSSLNKLFIDGQIAKEEYLNRIGLSGVGY
ncbi:MAG: hypothetical protein MCSN_6270 [Candidatus Microsyncoccus archaeolyticus]|nr:MAG: hypothetical protein MCSN_6270 [Candidatus Parcubacteria bacterium]